MPVGNEMILRTPLMAIVACTSLCLAGMAAAQTPKRPLSGSDMFLLQSATDPEISPDGTLVAYVRGVPDITTDTEPTRIWIVNAATSTQKPLVRGRGVQSSPRWAPDGSQLAYIVTEGGVPGLFVQERETGSSHLVAKVLGGFDSLTWSPDGRQIAFVSTVKRDRFKLGTPLVKPKRARWAQRLIVTEEMDYRHAEDPGGAAQLFVVSSAGGEPRQITHEDRTYMGPLSWSSDGASIILAAHDYTRASPSPGHPTNTELYAVTVADGSLRSLTTRNGFDCAPQVSPDGAKIAYLGYDEVGGAYNKPELHVMNIDGSQSRFVSERLDRQINRMRWADDSSIYIVFSDHGEDRLTKIDLDGRMPNPQLPLASVAPNLPLIGNAHFSAAANGIIAYTGGGKTAPADIYLSLSLSRRGDGETSHAAQ